VHIVYFFTFGYSLDSWNSSGIIDREIKIFEKLVQKYNYKFTLVTYGGIEDKRYSIGKNIKVVPIYTLISKSENNFINIYKSFFLSRKLKKELGSFDLIKQNQLMGSWVSILLKISSRKTLYTRTGYDMFLFSIKERKSVLKKMLYYLLTQFTLLFSNLYSVTSNSDFEFVRKSFIVGRSKLILRPNWVVSIGNDKFNERYVNRILTVGRLHAQKNYSDLIKSLEGSSLILDVVGDGEELLKLKSLAERLNVNVNFLGIVKNSDLLEMYPKYKFFVSTSLFEGNPKAILEAMSAGCIVIARDISNNSELITTNINGILYDDKKVVLKNLLKNLDEKAGHKNISNNAVNYIKDNNSIEKLLRNLQEDFDKLTTAN
jgi:glycosyltransferase involved in cell wall biosynthesis